MGSDVGRQTDPGRVPPRRDGAGRVDVRHADRRRRFASLYAVVEVPSLGPSQCGEALDAKGHASAGLKVKPCDLGKLQRFDTLEQDGLVFVFMGGDASRARRPAFRVPYWGQPEWTVYFMVTRFPNGVTNLAENFMDVPHTVFVHRGWFRNPARKRVPATVKRSEGSVLVTYKQEQDTVTGLGRIFNPSGLPMVHTDHDSIPNITRVDYMWGERSGLRHQLANNAHQRHGQPRLHGHQLPAAV